MSAVRVARGTGLGRAARGALTAALALLVIGCGRGGPDSGSPPYESPGYGFVIDVPDTLVLREYLAEYVAIGRGDGGAFAVAVEIVVEAGVGADFEAAAVESARRGCVADGPGTSLECTEVEALQLFASVSGVPGIVFYLAHRTTRAGTDEVLAVGRRGPFFAFEGSRFDAPPGALVFVRAPVTLDPSDAEGALVRRIASSIRRR
jgi:hypothetical protein